MQSSFSLRSQPALARHLPSRPRPPRSQSIPGQQNVSVNITASSSAYRGPITVTLTGLPSGITVSPLTLTAGGSGTLTLNASLSAGQEGFSSTLLVGAPTSWTAPVIVVGIGGFGSGNIATFPYCFHLQSFFCSGSLGHQPSDREHQYEWRGDCEQDNRCSRHHHHHFSRRPDILSAQRQRQR